MFYVTGYYRLKHDTGHLDRSFTYTYTEIRLLPLGTCSYEMYTKIAATDTLMHLQRKMLSQHTSHYFQNINESRHEIANNVVCATSKASDQPVHTRSLIRGFASRLSIL